MRQISITTVSIKMRTSPKISSLKMDTVAILLMALVRVDSWASTISVMDTTVMLRSRQWWSQMSSTKFMVKMRSSEKLTKRMLRWRKKLMSTTVLLSSTQMQLKRDTRQTLRETHTLVSIGAVLSAIHANKDPSMSAAMCDNRDSRELHMFQSALECPKANRSFMRLQLFRMTT